MTIRGRKLMVDYREPVGTDWERGDRDERVPGFGERASSS